MRHIAKLAVPLLLVLVPEALAHHTHGNSRQVTATVYHPWFSGRTTYCGNTYNHWGISAAHPWLECGTKVRVVHGSRVLTVPIRDRCDCNSIDLSAGAAQRLGVPIDGIATVTISHR